MQNEMNLPIRAAPYRHQIEAADCVIKKHGQQRLREVGNEKRV